MTNILKQPYTNTEYANFAVYCNENNKHIEQDDNFLYAVGEDEILVDGEVVKNTTPEYLAQQAEEEQRLQAYKNITKRQLLIWLFLNKQKTEADIFNAINSIQDPSQKYLATVNYTGTNNFYFGNAFTPVIGGALGLSSAEITKMFDEAGVL